MGQQNSYMSIIGVPSMMHLMHSILLANRLFCRPSELSLASLYVLMVCQYIKREREYWTPYNMCAESNRDSSVAHMTSLLWITLAWLVATLTVIHVCMILSWPLYSEHKQEIFLISAIHCKWRVLIGQYLHSKHVTFHIHILYKVQTTFDTPSSCIYPCYNVTHSELKVGDVHVNQLCTTELTTPTTISLVLLTWPVLWSGCAELHNLVAQEEQSSNALCHTLTHIRLLIALNHALLRVN